MAKIFISYRKKESAYPADMIDGDLAGYFGRENVFKDESSINLGRDYRGEIIRALSQCKVMLALIGEQWLNLKNKDGVRRIDEPEDWVRIEIETALERGIPVIPVLLDQANIPEADELPESIRKLVHRQATRFRREDRKRDCEKLIAYLDKVIGENVAEVAESFAEVADSFQMPVVHRNSPRNASVLASDPFLSNSSPVAAPVIQEAQRQDEPSTADHAPSPASAVDTRPNTDTGPSTETPPLPLFKKGDRPLKPLDWELQTLLGRGGFGEVWTACNPHMPGLEPVALKFCTHPSARDYFQNESKLISTVMHLSRHTDGFVELQTTYLNHAVPCLQYKYYPDGTLADEFDRLRPGNMIPVEKATRIILMLAKILAHAHECQLPIVHRDLKPSNILRHVDKQGNLTLRITDFGISQFAAQVNLKIASEAAASEQAIRLGAYTPLYASPQQKAQAPANPRDDIFALGVIWHQLLVSDRSRGAPTGDAWKSYLRDKRKVPEPLLQLLSRCMDASESVRPRNAVELHRLLENILSKPLPQPSKQKTAPQAVLTKVSESSTTIKTSNLDSKVKDQKPKEESSSGCNPVIDHGAGPVPKSLIDKWTRKPRTVSTVSSKPALISGGLILLCCLVTLIMFSNNILSRPLLLAVVTASSILGVVFLCIGWYRYLIEQDSSAKEEKQ